MFPDVPAGSTVKLDNMSRCLGTGGVAGDNVLFTVNDVFFTIGIEFLREDGIELDIAVEEDILPLGGRKVGEVGLGPDESDSLVDVSTIVFDFSGNCKVL